MRLGKSIVLFDTVDVRPDGFLERTGGFIEEWFDVVWKALDP